MKYILPAKLMNLRLVYNGNLAGSWERPPVPEGKVHIQRGRSSIARCGRRGMHTDWTWKVRSEHICKQCLMDWLHGDLNQIEIDL
jgi:hypothetical protein